MSFTYCMARFPSHVGGGPELAGRDSVGCFSCTLGVGGGVWLLASAVFLLRSQASKTNAAAINRIHKRDLAKTLEHRSKPLFKPVSPAAPGGAWDGQARPRQHSAHRERS